MFLRTVWWLSATAIPQPTRCTQWLGSPWSAALVMQEQHKHHLTIPQQATSKNTLLGSCKRNKDATRNKCLTTSSAYKENAPQPPCAFIWLRCTSLAPIQPMIHTLSWHVLMCQCIATRSSNKCLTSSNKKLVVTSASLVVASASLVCVIAVISSNSWFHICIVRDRVTRTAAKQWCATVACLPFHHFLRNERAVSRANVHGELQDHARLTKSVEKFINRSWLDVMCVSLTGRDMKDLLAMASNLLASCS